MTSGRGPAEQVHQNVLRESAKEFERFRVIDNLS